MNVSPRGLRAFRSRPASRRQHTDMVVLAHIKEQSRLSLGSYGRPRMTEELKEVGIDVGHRRVGRLMRENGIVVERTRRFKATTDCDHTFNIAPNLLDRDFTADRPNQKWAGDISYLWTREGWLYLAVIVDLHSRRVIGWAVSNRMKRDLAIRALKMAIALRSPPRGCMFHSDRGSQYCSHDYQKVLRDHGLKASMSGKGNCYDNDAVLRRENSPLDYFLILLTFFKTIKAELIWRRTWETRRQAETAFGHSFGPMAVMPSLQYINGFYNPRGRHSALGGKSPLAFERKVAKTSTGGGTHTRQVHLAFTDQQFCGPRPRPAAPSHTAPARPR
jgi:transposase InsO family protein